MRAEFSGQRIEADIVWDLDDPQNTAFSYGLRVAHDLALSIDFADVIIAAVDDMLTKARVC